ncbi:PL10A [Symbiodinium natans]|uniref:PL10A protein n=1 Tax=Symbiodinium natans TaxID=878477 RepID=A0A812RR58_9DINO|nr:PL10A [Symbiodinium natans]
MAGTAVAETRASTATVERVRGSRRAEQIQKYLAKRGVRKQSGISRPKLLAVVVHDFRAFKPIGYRRGTFASMQGAGGDWFWASAQGPGPVRIPEGCLRFVVSFLAEKQLLVRAKMLQTRSTRFGNKRNEQQTELEVFGPPKTRSTSGIDFDKYDAIPVQVSGENSTDVKPIVRFSEAKLVDSLFDNLRRCGYDRPTPVQKYSIPIVLSGRDLMACAQTGSGKTCAFMVPCLESLLRSGPPQQSRPRLCVELWAVELLCFGHLASGLRHFRRSPSGSCGAWSSS